MADATIDDEVLLRARVRLPQHVVHREFVSETVVLNLETGQYHGLNPTAGRMLEALQGETDVRGVAAQIATQYGQNPDAVQNDLLGLCRGLLDRGLITIADNGA